MMPLDWIEDELAELEQAQLLRRRTACRPLSAALVEFEGRTLINFAANDYLGLAFDPRVVNAAAAPMRDAGWGAGASPLITGRHAAHDELERALAQFEGSEAAILFPSGFAANLGTIQALTGRGDAIFSDARNHASIIDGCRLSRAELFVFRHADVDHLERLLQSARGYRRRLIVTDGLFSMDGDLAPLRELADLAGRFDAMLMVDEAHATGVFGARGRGVAECLGVHDQISVRVGTLSKALGSAGGFVAGSRPLVDWLANRARPYVFSTSPPSASCEAALAALAIVESEPERRRRLLVRAESLRQTLYQQGWNTGASSSQIIPLIVGDEAAALDIAHALRDAGFWVPAIRPPSVPRGQARLRVSLSDAHTPEMIELLCSELEGLARRVAAGATQA